MAKKKPGKYDHLKKTLQKFEGNDRAFLDRVNVVKRAILDAKREEAPILASNSFDNLRIDIQNTLDSAEYLLTYAAKIRTTPVPGVDLRPELKAFASGYRDARMLKEALEAARKRLEVYVQAYTNLFDEQADADGVEDQLRLDDGSTYRTQGEPFLVIKDKAAFNQWCKENGYEPEMSLLWQTANGIVKNRLEEGEEIPPGADVFWVTKMVHGKAKE